MLTLIRYTKRLFFLTGAAFCSEQLPSYHDTGTRSGWVYSGSPRSYATVRTTASNPRYSTYNCTKSSRSSCTSQQPQSGDRENIEMYEKGRKGEPVSWRAAKASNVAREKFGSSDQRRKVAVMAVFSRMPDRALPCAGAGVGRRGC